MNERIFTPDQLEEFDVPYTTLHDEQIDSRRWADTRRCVFRAPDDGKAYRVTYQVPATEYQECDTWFADGQIHAVEVEQRPVAVQQWKPVDHTATMTSLPTDEDFLVAIESALEAQPLPLPGVSVLERTRDAVTGALAPLVAALRAAPAVPSAPADRAAILREAIERVLADDLPFVSPMGRKDVAALLRRMADEAQPATSDQCPHGCDVSRCPCLACEAEMPGEAPCCSDPTCTCIQVSAAGRCGCAKWDSPSAAETQPGLTVEDFARMSAGADVIAGRARLPFDQLPAEDQERHRQAARTLLDRAQATADEAQQPETQADTPRCVHCTHPKGDHSDRKDHTPSPTVPRRPWCHACNAACDYDEQPAAVSQPGTDTPPIPCNAAHLRVHHAAHNWEPQPGMERIPCPGYPTSQPGKEA